MNWLKEDRWHEALETHLIDDILLFILGAVTVAWIALLFLVIGLLFR